MRTVVLICVLVTLTPALIGAHTRFARNDHGPVDFTGHKVIRIKPANTDQTALLRHFGNDFEMDFWNPVFEDLRPVLTIVDPQREAFLTSLNRSKIAYEVVTNNYQTVVDQERSEMELARAARNPNYDYENSYHTYAEILAQIKYLANTYPAATYVNVGTTYEGREIPGIIIGTGAKVVFLECGIHSREWVTISFGVWVSNYLLSQPSLAPLLAQFKFIVVPVLNVDGFVFTHASNRLWRKTRSLLAPGSNCIGADPNRNWDTSFCSAGASNNPCSETYCGAFPFSEVEAKQMSNLINQYKAQTVAYFAIHSYSQLWMWPWGYTNALPPNAAQLTQISNAALTAIKNVNGLTFTQGSIANAIYLASGSSADWAYDNAGIKISFAIELRDLGQYGFQLPANQIKPAVYETWAGLQASLNLL